MKGRLPDMERIGDGLPQPVHVRSLGSGPRRVLAIHCTIAHSGAWKGLAAALDQEATLTAFDLLSHGPSPDWDGRGDFQDRNVAAAETLLGEPMDLIGHSFGATVALRLAIEHPDRVRSLTMIEPVFFAVARQDAPDLFGLHEHDAIPFREALEAGDAALAARLFNRMWSTDASPRWPRLPEATRAAMTRGIHVVPACHPSLYLDRSGILSSGQLEQATTPALLLRGSLTHPVIRAVNDGLARRMQNAKNVVIDNSGHMLPISHPNETAEEIRTLWSQ
ncbi:alpha/beta fold hydrolase [Primorskyibacter sp. S87]|uniref:alpha/beta fold hydrolase n=1 Tax=Primorskyibacter sp. S87 TaxID=3415126 RepID=UPI003C7CF38B